MSLFALILLFMEYGILCLGGGYVLIPLLTADLVEKHHLITPEVFGQLISLAQMTPGPIGINIATYVGFTTAGIPGAILVSIALIIPSFFLVILTRYILENYSHTIWVRGVLSGLTPAALALIFIAVLIFSEISIFTTEIPWVQNIQEAILGIVPAENQPPFQIRYLPLLIAGITIFLQFKTKISFIWILLASALVGALFYA